MIRRFDEIYSDLLVFEDSPKRVLESVEDRGGYLVRKNPNPQVELYDDQKDFPVDGFVNKYCRRSTI